MLQEIIANKLEIDITELAQGDNLFIELTNKKTDVVLILFTNVGYRPLDQNSTEFRKIRFQILVKGFGTVEANNLSENIISSLADLSGDHSDSEGKNYHVFNTEVVNGPILIDRELPTYSVNFDIIVRFD